MVRLALSYPRAANENYETPAWVTWSLLKTVRLPRNVLEPACGSGKMVKVLRAAGHQVYASDIVDYGFSGQNGEFDFLTVPPIWQAVECVATNPPYGRDQGRLASKFITRALELTAPHSGLVAMLLPADYDHAASRWGLFGGHPAFSARLILTRRIRWIEGSTGSPSQNHCWFVWDWRHRGPAQTLYSSGKEEGLEECLCVAA